MRVLITGGTGTISSGLVNESVNRGYDTYAITRGSNNLRNIDGANYLHADIWNEKDVYSVLENIKFDVVVECLAYDIKQLEISLRNFSSRCSQYVFVSTAGVYNRIGNQRIKESDLKNFTEWSYTKNKIECEKFLKEYSMKTGLKYTIIRPTVTYGNYRIPFPIATRTPGWTFFDRMKKGQIMLASDNVKFSVIHIDDFSKMVVSLFGNEKAFNEDFHITSNENDIHWDDVIEISGKILGVKPQFIHVSANVIQKIWPEIYEELAYNKNLSTILDDSKIKKISDITAEIDISRGIENTIDAMKIEYNKNGLELDDWWNDHCNAVIYYAYANDYLEKIEKDIVSSYIAEYGIDQFKNSFIRVKRYNKIQLVKGKLKIILKRIK